MSAPSSLRNSQSSSFVHINFAPYDEPTLEPSNNSSTPVQQIAQEVLRDQRQNRASPPSLRSNRLTKSSSFLPINSATEGLNICANDGNLEVVQSGTEVKTRAERLTAEMQAQQNKTWTIALKEINTKADQLHAALKGLSSDVTDELPGFEEDSFAWRILNQLQKAELAKIKEKVEKSTPERPTKESGQEAVKNEGSDSQITFPDFLECLAGLREAFEASTGSLAERAVNNKKRAKHLFDLMSKDHIRENKEARLQFNGIEESWNKFSLSSDSVNWNLETLKTFSTLLPSLRSFKAQLQSFDEDARKLRDAPFPVIKDTLNDVLKNLVDAYSKVNVNLSEIKWMIVKSGLTSASITPKDSQLDGYINIRPEIAAENKKNLQLAVVEANKTKDELYRKLAEDWMTCVTITGEIGLKISQLSDKQDSSIWSIVPRTKFAYQYGIAGYPTAKIKHNLETTTYSLKPSEAADLSFLIPNG